MKPTKNVHQMILDVNAPATLEAFEAILRSVEVPPGVGGALVSVTLPASVAGAVKATWNTGNRRYDAIHAQKVKRAMEDGGWQGGREIGFGVFAGSIILGDGQHRMGGQSGAGVAVNYTVRIFNDPAEFNVYVATVDAGRVRTLGDLFVILGVAESRAQATVNAMHSFLGAKVGRLNSQERLDFAKRYVPQLKFICDLPTKAFKAHVLACIAYAHAHHAKETEAFIQHVISGAELPAQSPALEFTKGLVAWNAARGADKDRQMGHVLRVLHDGIRGRSKSFVRGVPAVSASVTSAIAALVSQEAAAEWTSRQDSRRGSGK